MQLLRITRERPDPWRRSLEESISPRQRPRRHVSGLEALLAAAVIAGLIAFAVWFLFSATGGLGWGSL